MESQPQNPEFRNNPENFHLWIIKPFKPQLNSIHLNMKLQLLIKSKMLQKNLALKLSDIKTFRCCCIYPVNKC